MSDASNSQLPGYEEAMRGEPGALDILDETLDKMSEDELLALALKTIHEALTQLVETVMSLQIRVSEQNLRLTHLEQMRINDVVNGRMQ